MKAFAGTVGLILLVSLPKAFWGQDLPAGDGRETLRRVCTDCHDIDSIPHLKYSRQEWTKLVFSMKDLGANATSAELHQIIEYLTKNFGKGEDRVSDQNAPVLPKTASEVTFDRILHADKEPQNWLTYSGSTFSQRYSNLTQINTENVNKLAMAWAFQARSLEKFESTPLVVDGMMYIVQAPNDVIALDAATGAIRWLYSYSPSAEARPCCGRVNRGVAILGTTLFMATIDAHLVALDARNGTLVWDREVAKAGSGYAMTLAPLIVKDKVIIGTAGGEFGIRGFIAAYEANTGKEAWRFYTIPGPGERGHESWVGDSWMHGGGPVWVTGSYDPQLNLTYWGIGNPGPDWNGDKRPGDNLYTESVVALEADTGKLIWYFQFTPHDTYDYDAVQIPVLADVNWPDPDGRSQPRKIMLWANRNGFYYVLDRRTGEFLLGKPFVKVTWASGLDEKGRPLRVKGMEPSTEGTIVYPSQSGGTNWYSPSFSPRTGLFYIPTWDNVHASFKKAEGDFDEGKRYVGGGVQASRPSLRGPQIPKNNDADGYGAVRAIDPKTGERRWEFKMADVNSGGILTTASDVLFSGGREGFFHALDSRTGTLLWKVATGGEIAMGPMTYQVNGKQYIVVASGSSLFTFGLK